MNSYNSSRYIHTIWPLQPGKKDVAWENAWFIKQIDVGQYNHYIWLYWPDFPDLQETARNLDPENIVKDNFHYEVPGYSA